MENVSELLTEGFFLKELIDKKKERLKEVNEQLLNHASFGKKKSATVENDDVVLTISKSSKTEYDQEKLALVKSSFDFFEKVFNTVYTPVTKELNKALKADENFKKAISWAKTVKQNKPSFSYESVRSEEGEENKNV